MPRLFVSSVSGRNAFTGDMVLLAMGIDRLRASRGVDPPLDVDDIGDRLSAGLSDDEGHEYPVRHYMVSDTVRIGRDDVRGFALKRVGDSDIVIPEIAIERESPVYAHIVGALLQIAITDANTWSSPSAARKILIASEVPSTYGQAAMEEVLGLTFDRAAGLFEGDAQTVMGRLGFLGANLIRPSA